MPDFALLSPSFSMVHPHQDATHHLPFNNLFSSLPGGSPHSNDAFDSATGVDRTKRESVVNLTGGKHGLVLLVANLFLLAGAGLLTRLIASSADGRPAGMLMAAIACGYVYQGPPFRCENRGAVFGARCMEMG